MSGRQALFVLGMHRSGTSALARVLNLLGAALPDDLLGANAFNPTGYWEPRAVIACNQRFLAELGATWDAPAFDPEKQAARRDDMIARAADVLAKAYGEAELIAVKDPRCTLFSDIWAEAAERAGYQPRFIAIARSADAVAQSLERRDAMSADEAGALWSGYGAAALTALAERGGALLDYDAMTRDWRGELARAAETGVALDLDDPVAAKTIEDFLTPANPAPEASFSPRVADWVDAIGRTYAACRAGERTPPPAAVVEALNDHGALAAASVSRNKAAAEARLDEVLTERDVARRTQAEAEARAKNASAVIASLETERDEARQQLEETRRSLEAERDAEREAHARLEDDFKQLEASVAAFQDEAGRLGEELRRTQSDYAAADAERVALGLERARLTHRLQAIETSAWWRAGGPVRRLAKRAPWLATPLRRAAKLFWWTASGQLLSRMRARNAAPETAAAPAPAAAPPLSAPANPLAGLEPVLTTEFGAAAFRAARDLIERYGLAFQSDGRPPVAHPVDAAQARSWAKRLAGLPSRASHEDPHVSIIIPAYNQIAYTLACLESVLTQDSDHRFEVLIGDDQSTDGTAAAAEMAIKGVTWIRHESNQGFVGNCNATARKARGRFVVFLNNDTLVLPGWLDGLIDTFEHDETIGLVGSKLIYPDGRLQEAGGIFWQDGSAWNYGRFDDPRRPQYSYARQVDYISGASIALPRALWEALGGFDEHYRPAYAEDADLAFRVRAHGRITLYQPRSQLVHFEGVTSGTDLGSGAKAHQVANLKKLHERWKAALAAHRPNGEAPELEKERAVARRALFIDLTTPEPAHDAGSLVAVECMRALQSAGYKVSFVPEDNFLWTREFSGPLQAMGVEALHHPYVSRFADFIRARGGEFDLIFIHRFEAAERVLADVRAHASQARVALLNADLHYLREMREAALSGDADRVASAEDTRRRELAVFRAVDLVLTHSTVEREVLAEALPGEPVMHLPLIHDPDPTQAGFAERNGIGFIGGFGHPPNGDAVDWFLAEVWPNVRARLPEARFVLAGSKMPDRYRALHGREGVEVMGFVERLDDFFNTIRLSVAPLRYGAGAKGKVAASLALGVPCVATSIAAEGMGLEAGRDIAVRDDPDALAQAVIALHEREPRWAAMRQAGLAFAAAQTSRAVVQRRIHEMLDALGLGETANAVKHHVS